MFDIKEYLENHKIIINNNKNRIVESFLSDMKNKLRGKESSLGMLSSFLNTDGNLRTDEKVIVIDAGGTNLRISALYFDNKKNVVIDYFKQVKMPGVNSKVTKDQFYSQMAELVIPVNKYSDKIGFCFSYPVKLVNSQEGTIINMCKEIKAPGVVGTKVCENLNNKIKELGGDKKSITLLNDSTATLLAGVSAKRSTTWDSYIGFILGTGSNSCYIEDYIINVESGWFSGVERGDFDILLDEKSINPGSYYLEKMCSGAYLGTLATYILKDLYNKGEINSEIKDLSTKDINDYILENNINPICKKEDHNIVYTVIDKIIERSASYIAINLASLIIKSGKGKNKDSPICISADGSTFYNLKNYKVRVEKHLQEILEDRYYYNFIKVDNAPVVGAAVAALSY